MANTFLWIVVVLAALAYVAHLVSQFLLKRRYKAAIQQSEDKARKGYFKSKGKDQVYAANQTKLYQESLEQQEIKQRKRAEELDEKARRYRLAGGNRLDPQNIKNHRSNTKSPREMVAESRLIREIQEEEYRKSLEADQLKEAKQQALKQKIADDELKKKQVEVEKVARIDFLKTRLGVEPPASVADTCEIIVRFPDGAKNQRRYLLSSQVQDVIDLSEIEGFPPTDYSLFSSYPRMKLDDVTCTFNQLKFNARVTLHCTKN